MQHVGNAGDILEVLCPLRREGGEGEVVDGYGQWNSHKDVEGDQPPLSARHVPDCAAYRPRGSLLQKRYSAQAQKGDTKSSARDNEAASREASLALECVPVHVHIRGIRQEF